MAGFVAADAVEKLDFDFSAFDGAKGTIPEPSTKQVKTFFKELNKVAIEANRFRKRVEGEQAEHDDDDDLSDNEAMETLLNLADEESERFNSATYDAIVKVCSEAFSKEDLDKLPHRVLSAFVRWLQEQIRPEGQTPAGK